MTDAYRASIRIEATPDDVFPYLTGSITPEGELRGGTVEYPVLSGLLMWVAAVPAHTDGEFLLWSALLMAPFGLATAWMLQHRLVPGIAVGAAGGWLIQLVVNVAVAYALSKLRPVLGRIILGAMLASLMLPAAARELGSTGLSASEYLAQPPGRSAPDYLFSAPDAPNPSPAPSGGN